MLHWNKVEQTQDAQIASRYGRYPRTPFGTDSSWRLLAAKRFIGLIFVCVLVSIHSEDLQRLVTSVMKLLQSQTKARKAAAPMQEVEAAKASSCKATDTSILEIPTSSDYFLDSRMYEEVISLSLTASYGCRVPRYRVNLFILAIHGLLAVGLEEVSSGA